MSASLVVAAANSAASTKTRADLVCSGEHDERTLLRSLQKAPSVRGMYDINPAEQREVTCRGRHRVLWLPGDYHLAASLVIPDAMDMVIDAEGACLHYALEKGDAVVVQGMNRCRYNFGVIESRSVGAALAVRPTAAMPALMSFVEVTGLIGGGQRGVGLLVDAAMENVCVNRFTGTDISGFCYGVRVMDAGGSPSATRPTCKCDTNQYWFAYIRQCTTCIEEGQTGRGIDCAIWTVNVDATLPGSVAIRTAASGNRWTIVIGTWESRDTRALVIGKDARDNRFDLRPPLQAGNHPHLFPGGFPYEDHSGSPSNQVR